MENLGILLSKNPDLIYLLMKKIDVEIKKILPFGPSNSSDIEPLFFNTAQEDILSLKFKKSLNSFERARLLVKAEQGCVRIEKPPFLNRYIRGMGVCNHFNFFALMILAKEYDFLAMLENIFSDESHTYVVLFASNQKRYILDAWSGAALAYENDTEWNESMPIKYSRKQGSKVETDSYWSSTYLRTLWTQLEAQEVQIAKKAYYERVIAKVTKSYSFTFFAPRLEVNENDSGNTSLLLCDEEDCTMKHSKL